MKKYILTKFHILQYLHDRPATVSDLAKFFHKYHKYLQNQLEDLEHENYIRKVRVPHGKKGRMKTVYFIIDRGKKLINKYNGNICHLTSSKSRYLLEHYPSCEIPNTLDVNWDEESPYTHPLERLPRKGGLIVKGEYPNVYEGNY